MREAVYGPSHNPYHARLLTGEGPALTDGETEKHAGKWRERFTLTNGLQGRLHLEIGCNAGHLLLERAARDPSTAFVGIDWKFKAIHRAGVKCAKRSLQNVRLLRAHASRIGAIFAEGEVDHVDLFFPDPWPKRAHWKHRLITETWLRALGRCVRAGGTTEIRTDHAGYSEWIADRIGRVQDLWRLQRRTSDRHAGNPNPGRLTIPDVTLFEMLFIRERTPIHSFELLRTADRDSTGGC